MKFFLAVKESDIQGHLDFEKIDILCENGERYTALNAEYLDDRCAEYFGCLIYLETTGRFKVAPEFYYQGLRTKLQMATQIKNFIIDNADGVVEFWGVASAAAWANMTQTFANNPLSIERDREEKFMKIMPKFCHELYQILPSNFVFPEGEHDARWVKAVYDKNKIDTIMQN